MLTMLIKGI